MPLITKPRLALLVAALALAGCGRRGDLEPPPNPNAVQTPQAKAGGDDMTLHKPNRKIEPPKKDFALDPLLQ